MLDETLVRGRFGARPRPLSPGDIARENGPPDPAASPPATPVARNSPVPDGVDYDDTPQPGDAYLAHSRLGNKPMLMLSFLLAGASKRTFAYGDLRDLYFDPAGGLEGQPMLVLRFIGVAEVRLEGRNLDLLHDSLKRHLIAWLQLRPRSRDFIPDDDRTVVITGMAIKAAE